MPCKYRGGNISCKPKGTKHGIYKYVPKNPIPTPIKYTPRKRNKHHRLGSNTPIQILEELNEHIRNPPEAERVCYQMAIYYHFIEMLDAPHCIHWKGKGGTISIILKALYMLPSQHWVIKRTLEEIMRCAHEDDLFYGNIENTNKLGRKSIILSGSIEETLIVNWMESYCGFCQTTVMVNEHRWQQDEKRISVYCIMSAFIAFNWRLIYYWKSSLVLIRRAGQILGLICQNRWKPYMAIWHETKSWLILQVKICTSNRILSISVTCRLLSMIIQTITKQPYLKIALLTWYWLHMNE